MKIEQKDNAVYLEDIQDSKVYINGKEYVEKEVQEAVNSEKLVITKGDYYVFCQGEVNTVSDKNDYLFGNSFQTKGFAEQVSNELGIFFKLQQLKEHFCPDAPYFGKYCTNYIYYDKANNLYNSNTAHLSFPSVGKVYFPEKIAQKIADGLNDGTIDVGFNK